MPKKKCCWPPSPCCQKKGSKSVTTSLDEQHRTALSSTIRDIQTTVRDSRRSPGDNTGGSKRPDQSTSASAKHTPITRSLVSRSPSEQGSKDPRKIQQKGVPNVPGLPLHFDTAFPFGVKPLPDDAPLTPMTRKVHAAATEYAFVDTSVFSPKWETIPIKNDLKNQMKCHDINFSTYSIRGSARPPSNYATAFGIRSAGSNRGKGTSDVGGGGGDPYPKRLPHMQMQPFEQGNYYNPAAVNYNPDETTFEHPPAMLDNPYPLSAPPTIDDPYHQYTSSPNQYLHPSLQYQFSPPPTMEDDQYKFSSPPAMGNGQYKFSPPPTMGDDQYKFSPPPTMGDDQYKFSSPTMGNDQYQFSSPPPMVHGQYPQTVIVGDNTYQSTQH